MIKSGKKLSNSVRFQAYVQGIIAGAWEDMKRDDVAKKIGVHSHTLRTWDRKHVNWTEVLETRREHFAKSSTEVDFAVLKAAKKGDIRAAALFYQKIEGWIPATEVNTKDGNDSKLTDRELAELKAMLEEKLTREGINHIVGSGEGKSAPDISANA